MASREQTNQIWTYVAEYRRELAAYLKTLPREDWDKPSLCEGWKVRHVVAHVILESRYGVLKSLPAFVRSGCNFNSFMDVAARNFGRQEPAELVRLLEQDIDKRVTPVLIRPLQVLVDLVIHSQDIARPLGRPFAVRRELLEFMVSAWRPSVFSLSELIVGITATMQGLKFEATDVEWTHGSGPVVRGEVLDLLLAITGRPEALAGLSGEGVPILAGRITRQ